MAVFTGVGSEVQSPTFFLPSSLETLSVSLQSHSPQQWTRKPADSSSQLMGMSKLSRKFPEELPAREISIV